MDKLNFIIKLLVINVYELYKSTLINVPSAHEKFQFLTNVKINDLVLETSSLTRHLYYNKDINDHIGILKSIKKNDKTECCDEYIIERLIDNKKVTWTNCRFIKVPQERLKIDFQDH